MSTPTSPSSSTLEAATAFVRSYGAAIALTQNPHTTVEEIATALVRHYSPHFTANDHGHTVTAPPNSPSFWLSGVTTHLKRFQKSGLGLDMKLSDYRIEVVGERAAKCHVTWWIQPGEGSEGWGWTNVYGWRDGGEVGGDGLRGMFESVVSDEETEELFRRVPGFLEIEV
jgi:hypothetical protein